MLRHGVVSLMIALLSLSLVASCSSLNAGLETYPAPAASDAAAAPAGLDWAGFPDFPADSSSKAMSWLSAVTPTATFAQHRAYADPLVPGGLVLEGLHGFPATHMPPPPYFAYALYQVPLGVHESDLLALTLTGNLEAAGQSYYVAIANFDALHWEWYGPGGAAAEYSIDMASLGYDLTGPWGNMYFAVAVPQSMTLYLHQIELDFADGSGGAAPTYWNVWGKAYDDYALGTILPGETVTFEDTLTATVFTTPTGGDGGWGTNLPDGFYKFNVTNDKLLFDPAGMFVIEELPVILEVNAGNIIYHGSNAAYDGNMLPMPIITANVF